MLAPRTTPPVSSDVEWLTLEQASKRLGVHATTLRRWADQGAIDVLRTPGGHRRFALADLQRFEREHHRTRLPASPAQQWIDAAIARTRQNLQVAQQKWMTPYDEMERESKRQLGRRLVGLLLQYAVRPDEGDDLLMEARAIGQYHAHTGLQHGQSLVDLLQAVSFFRTTVLEVAILQLPESARAQPDANVRLLRRVENLVDEVQVGVVEFYLSVKG